MLLGIDLGTTNVKAVASDRSGRPIAQGSCPVPLYRLANGGVEQDIEEIWNATLTAVRQAVGSIGAAEIASVGVSSQGGAMQVLDQAGRPLGRVISWLDQRGKSFDEQLTKELGRDWFRQRIVHGGSWLSIGQVLRLQAEQPGLLVAPHRIGFVGDVIVSRLCGRAAQDGTSAGLTLFYNPKDRCYDPDLLRRLKLVPEQFPMLIPPSEPAGPLAREIAGLTGLRPGIPLSAPVHDQYASALGTGAVQAGTVMVGTGTAWVLLATGARLPVPVTNDTFVCHHVIDGLWGQILSMVNGGSALTWALELTGLAGTGGSGIDNLLEQAARGSEGVRFWPYMTPFGATGLREGSRGRFDGLQLSHRAPQLIRAVVEGLAYELNRHLDFLRQANATINNLVLGGGAAASRVTPQLLADVTGLPLKCFGGGEASLRGATILARALLESKTSLAELSLAMLPAAKEIRPGPDRAFYEEQFAQFLATLPLAEGYTA